MPTSRTRRAVLAALAGVVPAGVALSPANDLLERGAPLSGSAWRTVGGTPATVESPYGPATVRYDDHHVPHVEADSEEAAYFAVGYAQAADRLPQMDLFRRRAGGRLAEVAGEFGLDNDRFVHSLDFPGAAEASREAVRGTDTEAVLEAFADGVNAYIEAAPPGLEFGLLDYEPEPWTVTDTTLVGVQLSWFLTGSFGTLRRSVRDAAFDEDTLAQLYPERLDHGVPIVRDRGTGGEIIGTDSADPPADASAGEATGTDGAAGTDQPAVDPTLVSHLSQFEAPESVGSNSWVVSGDVTDSGEPIVCNDPHLSLMAPPLWYQLQVAWGDRRTRGAAIVGTPFPTIGENDHGAWGLTNVGADVIDFYEYEVSDDGQRYEYRGETREFDTETRTIEVSGGEDERIEVKKTVHGAYVEREVEGETKAVGVAWTGMTNTQEIAAIHGWNRSTGLDSFRAASAKMDVPTQNLQYADREGNTLYQMSGRIPIRRVDGEVVRGDRVFDGSAGEAEWAGFEPYGASTWEGFVPFEEKLAVLNPDYLASANQRPADDPRYPVGDAFASGFRGTRIAERLDERAAAGDIDREFMTSLQTDTLSIPARRLVPAILDARGRMPDDADHALDTLAEWDYRMRPDSRAALVWHLFYAAFREATWADDFEAAGLDSSYWPQEWVLVELPPDSDFFDGDRAGVMAEALADALAEIAEEGWETYGDYSVTAIDHPFGGTVDGLDYTRYPAGGTGLTVSAFRSQGSFGPSYRLVADFGDDTLDVIPGGNDGAPFGDHYEDQLELWAEGRYRNWADQPAGDPDVTLEGKDE
jgi:penicillin amidase